MIKLKQCPCGKYPIQLEIEMKDSKYALTYGSCCNEWHIEFKTHYNPEGCNDLYNLAVQAWNEAQRDERIS